MAKRSLGFARPPTVTTVIRKTALRHFLFAIWLIFNLFDRDLQLIVSIWKSFLKDSNVFITQIRFNFSVVLYGF